MGWTTGREVQCGCGWEGHAIETEVRGRLNSMEICWVQYGCPMCHANVTEQTATAMFRTKIMPMDMPPIPEDSVLWEKYEGKTLRDDYYETRTLNDD